MGLPPYLEGEMERRRERLLALLNALSAHPDFGNIYEQVGKDLVFHWGPEKAEKDKILEIEEEFPELGLDERDGGYAITVASLIATITDVLCGKRVGFVQEMDGTTSGFTWWKPCGPSMNVELQQRREYRKDGNIKTFVVTLLTAGKPDANGNMYTTASLIKAAARMNETKGGGIPLPDKGVFIEAYVKGDDLNVVFRPLTVDESEGLCRDSE